MSDIILPARNPREHLDGVTKPDCDWKDRGSERGCRERSHFVLFLKNKIDNAYREFLIYGCRSHAPEMAKLLAQAAKTIAEREQNPIVVVVQDIDLARMEDAKQKRIIT